jgi:hypothetical protein
VDLDQLARLQMLQPFLVVEEKAQRMRLRTVNRTAEAQLDGLAQAE